MDQHNPQIPEKYIIWQPFLLACAVAFGIILGYKMNERSELDYISKLDPGSSIGRVEEVLRILEQKYVDSIDSDVLKDKAIFALLEDLDPYTTYLPPKEKNDVDEEMSGNFTGIGIESLMINDTVNVLTVLPNSPAAKSGLKPFDQILAINGKNIAGKKLPFEDIRAQLKNSQKPNISLKLLRSAAKDTFSIQLKNEKIDLNSVDIGFLLNDTTGFILIDQFNNETYKEFMAVIEKLQKNQKLKNLIIDLRGNPGGYLQEATKILNQLFLEKDKLLVTTVDKLGRRSEFKTNGKPFFQITNIAVLIDGNSASGAEIIAGALQDHDRATIFGDPSYGKGLVQEQHELANGGALRITTAKYYLPSGRSIQKRLKQEDSIAIKEGKKYLSFVKKRELTSFDGIQPDIWSDIKFKKDKSYYELMSHASNYVFTKLRYKKPIDVLEFISYAKQNGSNFNSSILNNDYKNQILDELLKAEQYILLNGNQNALMQKSFQKDDLVQKAILHFKK